jgi:hypothetical protein
LWRDQLQRQFRCGPSGAGLNASPVSLSRERSLMRAPLPDEFPLVAVTKSVSKFGVDTQH